MKINHIDDKIIGYIKENKIITIPDLQIKFSLSYPKAHEIIDECLKCNVIKYIEGICYEYISKEESKKNLRKEQNEIDEAYRRFERTIFDVIHGEDGFTTNV